MTDGILLIDKPAEMTSFGVVARVRRVLSEQAEGKGAARAADSLRARRDEGKPLVVPHKRKRVKVGHTGTLDPFATGLTIIVVGKECKNAENYSKLDKVYEATIQLGQSSTTGDPEGEITDDFSKIPSLEEVKTTLAKFTGAITQRPPMYSAIKIDGQRAYKLAREGKVVEMPERMITIHTLDLIDYTYPELKVRTHVSSGTYIRTLAEDIGRHLGTSAYCKQLRRTAIGKWKIDDAQTLQEFGVLNP
jgi:tRNA pseudouridine55 synthase